MDALTNFLLKLFQSKWFWIVVVIIIVLLIVNAHWDEWKMKLFGKKITSNYSTDSQGNVIPVTDLDKQRLDKLIRDTHSEIYGVGSMSISILENINGLTDQELEYFGKTYKQVFQTSLYNDLDDEWLPLTDLDDKILTRLATLKLS